MADITLPEFLENCGVDAIHEKMLDVLPADIDKTEGGFPLDFTRPTALIASELLEYYAPRLIQMMFPQGAEGEYLDLWATVAGVRRKAATYATVVLHITGVPGTEIPADTVFTTASVDGEASIEFVVDSDYEIDENGECYVNVVAAEAGASSNLSAGVITVMSEPISGVESVTNPDRASGGTDEETDEDLRERVMAAFEKNDESYIGNDADYKRWAESVDGMGTAIVISEWEGPETVKIVCINANGEAASQSLLDAVYNLIMSPDAPLERLAPPNVILTVAAPEFVGISYGVTVELAYGFAADTVQANFQEALEAYYKTISDAGEVKYTKVCSLLSACSGVDDFADLTMNGDTLNIAVSREEYPETISITITTASGVNDA